jgi:hypothetical protein
MHQLQNLLCYGWSARWRRQAKERRSLWRLQQTKGTQEWKRLERCSADYELMRQCLRTWNAWVRRLLDASTIFELYNSNWINKWIFVIFAWKLCYYTTPPLLPFIISTWCSCQVLSCKNVVSCNCVILGIQEYSLFVIFCIVQNDSTVEVWRLNLNFWLMMINNKLLELRHPKFYKKVDHKFLEIQNKLFI